MSEIVNFFNFGNIKVKKNSLDIKKKIGLENNVFFSFLSLTCIAIFNLYFDFSQKMQKNFLKKYVFEKKLKIILIKVME